MTKVLMNHGPRMDDVWLSQGAMGSRKLWAARIAQDSSVQAQAQAIVHGHAPRCSRDQELVRATLGRQKSHRERVFSQDLPFSWLRLLVGVVSVAFVLTDVPRSGLGISDLGKYYSMLEPDTTVVSTMPWAYSVFRGTRAEAASASARVWSYKFDTTSIVWRAFAHHLSVANFPGCLHYREACPSAELSGSTVFLLMDALVDAIAKQVHSPPLSTATPKRKSSPRKLTLRTASSYIDRLHDFLLPSLFVNPVWRTNEAAFFPSAALEHSMAARDICFGSTRPFFCQQLWINFDRTCARNSIPCRQVSHVYSHAMRRLREAQARFPNASVDLTFLTSAEDLKVSRMSLSAEGNRRADVSTIIRARTCSSESSTKAIGAMATPSPLPTDQVACETVYVEDYRYEIEALVSDVAQWFSFLVALRLVGQTYFYLRAVALVASCYYALGPRLSTSRETVMSRWRKTAHLLSKVPTQCIVFGSPFPILSYTIAHCIDASVMYRILEKRFITQNGILELSLSEFVAVAVIQMRSVWTYSMLLHATLRLTTWYRWSGLADGVITGVTGVPEFLLTAMASVNIAAQFRSTTLRSTRLLFVRETTTAGYKSTAAMLKQHVFTTRGGGTSHLGGVVIDLKLLICLVGLIVMASMARAAFVRLKARIHGNTAPGLASLNWPLGRTPVPYSADILWPAVSLCVHWTSDFFCIRDISIERTLTRRRLGHSVQISPLPLSTPVLSRKVAWRPLKLVPRVSAPSIRMSDRVFHSIQHQMESLHDRSDEVEGNVAFMNLVIMSDPIVYYQVCIADKPRASLAYYQSLKRPDKVVLLPEAAVSRANEPMCHLRRMDRVHPRDLDWSDLIQCG